METPRTYSCSICNVWGCKLWRDYGVVKPSLYCCDCAAERQGIDISDIHENGQRMWNNYMLTYEIGWTVPAIPSSAGNWLTRLAAAEERLEWWDSLPLRIEDGI